MKLRSLDEDVEVITLGTALLLINVYLIKEDTSSTLRIDFFDSKYRRRFSIEGNEKEIAIITTVYLLVGPSTPLEILNGIPIHFQALRDRSRSLTAYHQAIRHALGNIYGFQLPPSGGFNLRGFNRWLNKFGLP